jgi:two-component system, sporulation sensor kinase D
LGQEHSPVEGLGLGLLICKRLVESMGGQLRITSRVHEGTLVSITLPTADSLKLSNWQG